MKTILIIASLLSAACAQAQQAFTVTNSTKAFGQWHTNSTRPARVDAFFLVTLPAVTDAVDIRAFTSFGTNTNAFYWRGGITVGPGLALTNVMHITFPVDGTNSRWYLTNLATGSGTATTRTNFIFNH